MLVRYLTFGAGSAGFSSQAGEGLVTQESLGITPVKQIREMLHLESTSTPLTSVFLRIVVVCHPCSKKKITHISWIARPTAKAYKACRHVR